MFEYGAVPFPFVGHYRRSFQKDAEAHQIKAEKARLQELADKETALREEREALASALTKGDHKQRVKAAKDRAAAAAQQDALEKVQRAKQAKAKEARALKQQEAKAAREAARAKKAKADVDEENAAAKAAEEAGKEIWGYEAQAASVRAWLVKVATQRHTHDH
jgi:hypothetical protein